MKELLLYIARSLVDHPDQVTVTEVENGDELTLELRVAPEDMGKVIGRQGRIPCFFDGRTTSHTTSVVMFENSQGRFVEIRNQ